MRNYNWIFFFLKLKLVEICCVMIDAMIEDFFEDSWEKKNLWKLLKWKDLLNI